VHAVDVVDVVDVVVVDDDDDELHAVLSVVHELLHMNLMLALLPLLLKPLPFQPAFSNIIFNS